MILRRGYHSGWKKTSLYLKKGDLRGKSMIRHFPRTSGGGIFRPNHQGSTVKTAGQKFRALLGFVVLGVVLVTGSMARSSAAAELLLGVATTNITPKGLVALAGQMYTRIAYEARSPLEATALALESRRGDEVIDQAIVVSCDLIGIPEGMLNQLRRDLQDRLYGFDVKKLFLNATHTHTGPVLDDDSYNIPKNGVIQPADYVPFLTERLIDLIIRAWNGRKSGAVSWGLSHAVVAQNRRAIYSDGKAQMYGRTDVPQFRGIEGYEDHDVDVLFFWTPEKRLIAVAVDLACPAQEVEENSSIDADFWHEVRQMLRQRYSQGLGVLGWVGASGDQSPHLIFGKRAEKRMRELRGLTRLQEIARRICQAVDEAYEVTQKETGADIPLVHKVEQIKLPVRMVTDEELAHAKEQVETLSKDSRDRTRMVWHQQVIDRYQLQKTNLCYDMELHVIRLGDVAICTNPFELFTDFGIQIKARSKALQTFIIQLTGQAGYVPTEKAVRGEGYSATIETNLVGPEGGQVLVDRTVELINSLWADNP
jgi:hypothetical protein